MVLTGSPFIREVRSPLDREMLRPLDPRCRVVQFSSALTDRDCAQLAEFLDAFPHVSLRAYGGYDGSISDLEFLRHFPRISRFSADALYDSLKSIDGLRHLRAELIELGLGQTKATLSLAPLERFSDLRALYLEGQTKDIDVIGRLRSLTDVTLRSITLRDLSVLTPLKQLRSLDLKLGGTNNLEQLAELPTLRYLELWMVRGVDDLSSVRFLPNLRFLFLQALKNVTALPEFESNPRLERIEIDGLKGLRDLGPLARAAGLTQLQLVSMQHLQPNDLQPLIGSPKLERVTIGLGTTRKNDAANALLPLPNTTEPNEQFPECVDERGLVDWSRST